MGYSKDKKYACFKLYALFVLTVNAGFTRTPLFAQTFPASDSDAIKKIYDYELTKGKVFGRLTQLCTTIGSRLSGSANSAKAILWSEKEMKLAAFDRVYRQPVMVPHWERGTKETAFFTSRGIRHVLAVCALGGSVATPGNGVAAAVIEVHDFKSLRALGAQKVKGHIVFFNRPFDPRFFDTGSAYGNAVDQRVQGAAEAGRLGAVAVVVRSMTEIVDDYPHTGAMNYAGGVTKIPAGALSTAGAENLSAALRSDPELLLSISLHCSSLPDVLSYNVIGEIKGTLQGRANTIILTGGHLDSWDLAQGAHDDGAGAMQSLEAIELLKLCGYKPKHTLRAVLFINEENGTRGAAEYARLSNVNGEQHLAAIESDDGGFTPRGFVVASKSDVFLKMIPWQNMFKNYGSGWFKPVTEAGTDIEPLQASAKALIGFMPDNQRYFDIHHSAKDVITAVNQRELELGAASIAALVYLIDSKGL